GAPWQRTPLELGINDRWSGSFEVTSIGPWEYTLEAWIDHFESWREAVRKKNEAGLALDVELQVGAALVHAAARAASEDGGAPAGDAQELRAFLEQLAGDPAADTHDAER